MTALEILTRLLADIDDDMEFLGTMFNPKNQASDKVTRDMDKALKQLHASIKAGGPKLEDYTKAELEDLHFAQSHGMRVKPKPVSHIPLDGTYVQGYEQANKEWLAWLDDFFGGTK